MSQWSQETRARSLIHRSSVVTQALAQNQALVGQEQYQQLQGLEGRAVAAGAGYEAARTALQDAQLKRDEAEKDLSALNTACLVICRVRGVTAALLEEFDRGDPAGLAAHLETPVSRIESIGPMLAEMLRHQRKVLGKCSAAVEPAARGSELAKGELSSALFHLEAGIATSRALLASKGVAVKFPIKAKPGKKPRTGLEVEKSVEPTTPEAAPSARAEVPSNGASGHVEPSTALIGRDGSPS